MNASTDTQPGLLMRILRFAPVRLYLMYLVLPYLYLAGYFYRQAFAEGDLGRAVGDHPLRHRDARDVWHRVHYCERRQVTELALKPAARNWGLAC